MAYSSCTRYQFREWLLTKKVINKNIPHLLEKLPILNSLTDFFNKNPKATVSSQVKLHSIHEVTLSIFPMSLYKGPCFATVYQRQTSSHKSWLFVIIWNYFNIQDTFPSSPLSVLIWTFFSMAP